MAKKSKKKESEPKNEVITNCDNQQFAVANSCLGKRPVGAERRPQKHQYRESYSHHSWSEGDGRF